MDLDTLNAVIAKLDNMRYQVLRGYNGAWVLQNDVVSVVCDMKNQVLTDPETGRFTCCGGLGIAPGVQSYHKHDCPS
jgi:hypothetical protein